MEHLLRSNYAIESRNKVILHGKTGFQDDEYLYFTIPSNNKEIIHLEQAALAYYLYENNYFHTAYPIPTRKGEWFTTKDNNNYMVVKVERLQNEPTKPHGILLADFHQVGSAYSFEPQKISSYGQWKDLWIEKLTMFETTLIGEAKENSNNYYRLVMDILPYLIGVSENAIQYIQESEKESRYYEFDQGTITFGRYHGNLLDSAIWVNDLAYDHPTRDLAEYIRYKMLQSDNQDSEKNIVAFMNDYQMQRPLSVFSWRLLYARLLYPIQLFDCLQKGLARENFDLYYEELRNQLDRQVIYERRLGRLFDLLNVDSNALHIPVVQWL